MSDEAPAAESASAPQEAAPPPTDAAAAPPADSAAAATAAEVSPPDGTAAATPDAGAGGTAPATPAAVATPTSPEAGGSAYRGPYSPTFLQEHIKNTATTIGHLQGVNSIGSHAYQGVKANVGADSFMLQHLKANRNSPGDPGGGLQGVNSPPPGRSYQGVKANVGADSFMMQHLKNTKASMGTQSHRPFQGVKANVTSDSFLNSEVKKAQDQVSHRPEKARGLKPHMGSDGMMFEFARNQPKANSSHAWNSFALYSHREDGKNKPHMTADALGLRVTKPSVSQKPYQGVKANVGADSFHMSFLKSMKSWTGNKVWSSTSGSQTAKQEVKL
jgi:hypothetical protein